MFLISIDGCVSLCSQQIEQELSLINKDNIVEERPSTIQKKIKYAQEMIPLYKEELSLTIYELAKHNILCDIGLVAMMENYEPSQEAVLSKILIETSAGINTEIQYVIEQIKFFHYKINKFESFLLKNQQDITNKFYSQKDIRLDPRMTSIIALRYKMTYASCFFRLKHYFTYLKPYINYFFDYKTNTFKPKDHIDKVTFDHFNKENKLKQNWLVFKFAYSKYFKSVTVCESMTGTNINQKLKLYLNNPDFYAEYLEDEFYGFFMQENKDFSGEYPSLRKTHIDSAFLVILEQDIKHLIERAIRFLNANKVDFDEEIPFQYETYDIEVLKRASEKFAAQQQNSVKNNHHIKIFIYLAVFSSLALSAILLKNKFLDPNYEENNQFQQQPKNRL